MLAGGHSDQLADGAFRVIDESQPSGEVAGHPRVRARAWAARSSSVMGGILRDVTIRYLRWVADGVQSPDLPPSCSTPSG
jgi:hypothetical protein